MHVKQHKMAVIGLGYVGLPLAVLGLKKKFDVIGIDTNDAKLKKIQQGKSPFADGEIDIDLKRYPLPVTSDAAAIKNVDTVIICVPTPVYEDYLPDLRPVESVAHSIGKHLKKGHLVVLESTVNPGISEDILLPILEKESGLIGGKDFYLAHCPERINPGDKRWNVSNIPRVVGSLEKKGLERAVAFYKSLIDAEIKPMGSIKEAEAVKITENSFRDINIAFVNELAMSFSKLGIDVVNVIEGAATKPFSFMPHYPGCGVGGHCIPVDPYYLIEYAKKNGFNHKFLKAARTINNNMPEFTIAQLNILLKEKDISLKNSTVAVLGISYKAGVGDDRESPSHEIVRKLKKLGVRVVTYDPYILHASTAKTMREALTGADAVIIATAHGIFKKLTPQKLESFGVKVVIDGMNCLEKDKFIKHRFAYRGIGR